VWRMDLPHQQYVQFELMYLMMLVRRYIHCLGGRVRQMGMNLLSVPM
jgi:hypothetical protein